MVNNNPIIKFIKTTFSYLASLKVAIPLLVLLAAITSIGSLFPDPDIFRSWWYLSLLGLLGVSLLFITILHIPSILKRKGRNALIGVLTTHLGILVLIAGIIYGGFSGFRQQIKLIEGEITIIPGIPFVIRLDKLVKERYTPEEYPGINPESLPLKRLESQITLLKNGKAWRSMIVAPGRPESVDGITMLPSVGDLGWYFELVTTDPGDRKKIIPVRPWASPKITIGGKSIITHSLKDDAEQKAELFSIEDDRPVPVGVVTQTQPVQIGAYEVRLGVTKPYTGLHIYTRPQEPLLIFGSILMFVGLVWHFYFRHRERNVVKERDNHHA